MTTSLSHRTRTLRLRLSGVRARLVAVYVVVATLAGALGVLVFSLLLSRALHDGAVAQLRATADSFADEIRGGRVESVSPLPRVDAARARRVLPTIVAVYAPDGRLVDAEPAVLPVDPRRLVRADGVATVEVQGRSLRLLRESVPVNAGTWTVIVGERTGATDDAGSDARDVLLVLVPVAVVLSGVGAWLLSGAALRPVDRMRADAQRLGETGTSGAIGVPPTTDSLNKLARTFNHLLQRLHDSMQRQRDFVADAGHELRAPLAVLQTELETAVRPGRTRADLEDSIRHAQAETARLAALAEDLLLLAQADGPTAIVLPERIDPVEVVDHVVAAQAAQFEARGVGLTGPDGSTSSDTVADIDPIALRRILDNLLANALRHTPAGGTVTVDVRTVRSDLWVSVRDTGPGFDAGFLPHAFERFARADPSRTRSSPGEGSGLGLSIVATLAHAHGGSVSAENDAGGGAVVGVRFPLPDA